MHDSVSCFIHTLTAHCFIKIHFMTAEIRPATQANFLAAHGDTAPPHMPVPSIITGFMLTIV